MTKEVILSTKEYEYLMNNLLKNKKKILSKIESEKLENKIKIFVDEDIAYRIRELASNEVILHFDENYEPTKEGWILENLIDKFYVK